MTVSLVNATNTTETAFARFTCASSIAIAVMFFGRFVAGRAQYCGTWQYLSTVDPSGQRAHSVGHPACWLPPRRFLAVLDINTLGNPVCLQQERSGRPLIHLKRQPQLSVGGTGLALTRTTARLSLYPERRQRFCCQPCVAHPIAHLAIPVTFFRRNLGWKNALISNPEHRVMTAGTSASDAVDQEIWQPRIDAHGVRSYLRYTGLYYPLGFPSSSRL